MKRGILISAIIAGGLMVTAQWWRTSFAASDGATIVTAVGELAGLIGSYLVCVQVLLIARVPWFERAAGFDRLVAWHRVVGTTTVLLVAAHICFMVLGQWIAGGGGPVHAYLAVFHAYPDMLTAAIGAGMLLALGILSARALRRLLPYEVWYWTHVTTYVAIFLTFLHQLSAGPAFAGHPLARALWLALYLAVGACVVVWRIVTPLERYARHRFVIAAVVPESARMTSVWIRARELSELGARPGQFLLFRFLVRGHLLTSHPYSLSNVPQGDLLRITVADLGDHSGAVRDLPVGAKVLVEGPFGHVMRGRGTGGVLLVAGGAGIGPVRGLAEQFGRMGRPVTLLYRVSEAADLALWKELAELPGVVLVPVVGRRAELGFDPLEPGPLVRAVPDAARREAYVCGPEGMIERVGASLRALGVPERNIHFEELSLA